MDTFVKRDSTSLIQNVVLRRVYKRADLLQEKEMLISQKKSLDAEIKENDNLLAQCDRLGIE